jgi:hypothetical protein
MVVDGQSAARRLDLGGALGDIAPRRDRRFCGRPGPPRPPPGMKAVAASLEGWHRAPRGFTGPHRASQGLEGLAEGRRLPRPREAPCGTGCRPAGDRSQGVDPGRLPSARIGASERTGPPAKGGIPREQRGFIFFSRYTKARYRGARRRGEHPSASIGICTYKTRSRPPSCMPAG